jgi:hypothetical protein
MSDPDENWDRIVPITEQDKSDLSGLTEEDQEKLVSYDLLEIDARFAARRLCLFLRRYHDQIPAEAADYIRKILDELLMRHLLVTDRAWWADLVKKLEAA